MKDSALLALLAAALVGGAGAGALAVWLLSPSEPGTREPAPVPAPAAEGGSAPDPSAELLTRLDELAAANRELRARLDELEHRAAPLPRVPVADFASKEELEALRAEVRELVPELIQRTAASPGADVPEPASFEDRVAETLTAIRKQEKVTAVREKQEQRVARLDQDVARIDEWLQLDRRQTDELRTALLAQYERETELRRLWEEGVEDELLGERKRSDLESFRSDLEVFLTPAQLETFWSAVVGGGKE